MEKYTFKKFEGRNCLLAIQAHHASCAVFNDLVGEKLILNSGNFYKEGFVWWIGSTDDYIRARNWFIAKMKENPRWGIEFYRQQFVSLENFIRSFEKERDIVRGLSCEALTEHTKSFIVRSGETTSLAYFTDWYAYDAQNWIYDHISRDVLTEKDFSVLTSAWLPSFVKEYEYELAKLKTGDSDKSIDAIAQEYAYARDSYQYVGSITAEVAKKDLEKMSENEAREAIDYVENELKRANESKDRLLNSLPLNDFQKTLLFLLSHFVDLQDKRKAAVFVTNNIAFDAYQKILDCKHIKEANDRDVILRAAFPFWIIDKSSEELVRMSKEAEEGALKIIYQNELLGSAAEEKFKMMAKVLDHETRELKGYGASRGVAKGMVKVINQVSDFEKFCDGDVLISSMTRPEMSIIMQKAVAFVTDEGGITCHAAIIAREMKKPCIIGTKIATQVLKDGMFVEVDANEGIVRILKT